MVHRGGRYAEMYSFTRIMIMNNLLNILTPELEMYGLSI